MNPLVTKISQKANGYPEASEATKVSPFTKMENTKINMSMKEVSRIINNSGIDIPWSVFHRCIRTRQMNRKTYIDNLMAKLGLDEGNRSKLSIMLVPEVIERDIMDELRRWADGKSRKAFDHLEADNTPESRAEIFALIYLDLKKLADQIRDSHGSDGNTEYLRSVYSQAIESLQACHTSHMSINRWMKTLNATQDSRMLLLPRVTWLIVSRMTSLRYGCEDNISDARLAIDTDKTLQRAFSEMHISQSALDKAIEIYSIHADKHDAGVMTESCLVKKASAKILIYLQDWVDRAYGDHIAHAMVMDQKFIAYFSDTFNIEIEKRRFLLAKSYRIY